MWRSILSGIVWALLGAFPAAAFVALCYRFPIPFSGYESGLLAVPRALLAIGFYELYGGFVVLTAIGAAAGIAAHLLASRDAGREYWLTLTFALAGDLVAVMILAVLDKIIGNW
jgi:hypothetical protein